MRKLLLFFFALLASVSTAWAATYTITFDHTSGTFYKGGAVSTGWVNQWVSNEAGKPAVTITASANNIDTDNGRMAPGSSGTCTYTLTTESGYVVTGFSMNCPTFGAAVTVTPTGESAIEVAQNGTLVVNSSASSFVYSGSNSGRIQASASDGGTFTITVEDDTEAQSWVPSFGTGSTIIVDSNVKAESVTAATNGADNDHWYLITQVRNGESALYDDGTKLMRGATDKTAGSFNGVTVDGNTAFLVRFISAGSEDLYHIQLGNGKYIVNLDADPSNGTAVNTTTDYRNKGTHAFYNSNGGSGSYFGWNLNSKTGKKVDNNGAGNNLSYWGEGTASGTSGNSIWYVYPVTINTPAATVDVTYDFYVNSVKVNTETVTVGANSEINIPSTLTAGYSSSYYNFNTSGTIGDTDCTITVTAVLKDNTVVYPYTSLSNSKSYYIYTNNQTRGGLSTYTDNGTTYLAASVKSALSLSPKKFAIISYESNYYLYSVDDAKFVTFDGSVATEAALASTVTGTSDRITFTQTNAPLYEIKFEGSSSKIFNASNSASYPYGIVFNTWGSTSNQWDDGCQYTINEADDFDATAAIDALDAFFHPATSVQYVISDANGVVFTSETLPATEGETISTLPAAYQLDYCNYTVTPKVIAAGANIVDVTVAYNLPFTVSTDFAGATWYYATLRGKQLRADDSAKDGSGRYATNSTNEYTDAYKWAFFGNPYAGIYVMNKNQGSSKYMAKDVQIVFSTTLDDKARWAITSNSNGGFTLRNINGGATWYVNDAGNYGNLGFWDSASGANDIGSNWVVTEVSTADVAAFNNTIATLEAINWGLESEGNKGKLNYYNFSASAPIEIGGYRGNEMAAINTLKSAGYSQENLNAAQALVYYTELNMPTAGFYRIQGHGDTNSSDKYLAAGLASNNKFNMSDATDATTIFYFDGTKLTNFSSGLCNGMTSTAWAWVNGASASTVKFGDGGTNGGYAIQSADAYFYDGNTSADRGGSLGADGRYRSWYLTEVTTLPVTISSVGYATLYAPVALTIPSGVKAYTGEISGEYLVLSEVSTTIPANTPVVLKGTAGTYNFDITTGGSVSATNNLSGNVAAIAWADGNYTLQYDGSDVASIGFYANTPTDNIIPGFKAYLASASGVKGYSLELETAVKAIEAATNPGKAVYDLNGRRVENPTKGLYIVNGKKVIIK